MNKAKRFLNTTLVYFIGTVLSKLVSFFLLPLYTDKIPPTEYGSYDLVLTLLNLIAPIAFFQIWDGMFRRSFDFDDEQQKYDVITNAHIVSAFGAMVYLVLFGALQLLCGFDNFVWAAVYGFFFSLHYMYGFIGRVFLRNKLLVATGLVNTIISATLNILLITVFDMGVSSLYIAPTVGTIVQIVMIEGTLKTFKHFRRTAIDRAEMSRMLRFSIPLCVAALSYWLLSGFTKVIITSMLGTYENGLYAVANKFGTIITLIVSIVQSAWNEMAYLMVGEKDRGQSYRVCVDIMMKSVILGTTALCICIKWIYPFLIDVQYEEGLLIVPATIIGVMFNSIAGFLGTLFMAENNTKTIMKSTLSAAGINIALCFVMTRLFGLHGATCSLMISFFILMILRLHQGAKQYGISFHPLSFALLLSVLGVAVSEYYFVQSVWIDALVVTGIIGIYLFSVKGYIKKILISLNTKEELRAGIRKRNCK